MAKIITIKETGSEVVVPRGTDPKTFVRSLGFTEKEVTISDTADKKEAAGEGLTETTVEKKTQGGGKTGGGKAQGGKTGAGKDDDLILD